MAPKKILIVEDDSDTRLAYHIYLAIENYETFFAQDPLSCLCQADEHRPDVILMDLGLAAGCNGFRAIEQLKAVPRLAGTPVIVVSCRPAREFAPRAKELGALAYLEKPVSGQTLLSIIGQCIGTSDDQPD